jgi:four helix bundle protein
MRISPDLKQQAKAYASGVARLFKNLTVRDKAAHTFGLQLLRSGTSEAVHTQQVSRLRSGLEFCSQIDGLFQEADESKLWLELLMEDCGMNNKRAKFLHKETDDLISIVTTIVSKVRRNL